MQRGYCNHWRSFCHAEAFRNCATGYFVPTLSDRLLQSHTAAHCKLHVGEITFAEFFVVQESIEQGIHRSDYMEFFFAQHLHHSAHITWVGNQNVARTKSHEQHAVHRQCVDVIKRQHGDHTNRVFANGFAHPGQALLHVAHQVALSQHGAFGNASGTTRVLQQSHIVQLGAGLGIRNTFASSQGLLDRHRLWQVVSRYHFLDLAHHKVHDQALQATQQIAQLRDHNVLDLGTLERLLQGIGKVLEHHNGGCARVFQLVIQFTHGVQGVDVGQSTTQLHGTHKAHRELYTVGQHNGHNIACLNTNRFQVARKLVRHIVDLLVRELRARRHKRGAVCILLQAFGHQFQHAGVSQWGHIATDAWRVAFGPVMRLKKLLRFFADKTIELIGRHLRGGLVGTC